MLAVTALAACTAPAELHAVIVTDHGLGLDKWVTAWLMARHAEPGTKLDVYQQGCVLSQGIALTCLIAAAPRARSPGIVAYPEPFGRRGFNEL